MPCPRMVGCPMFPVFTLKSSLRVWQARYCEGNFDECMRFRLQRSGTCAPPTLLPNGKRLSDGAATPTPAPVHSPATQGPTAVHSPATTTPRER